MAVYRIYPNKDTTLYSVSPTINAGRDEVLEVSSINYNNQYGVVNGLDDIRRTLIQFSNTDISLLNSLITGSYKAYLNLHLAYASALPLDYTVECYPVSQSWDMGTGKFSDTPNPKNGTSWYSVGAYSQSVTWSLNANNSSILYTSGGGTWLTAYKCSQSFDYVSDKDIEMDITGILTAWISGSISNNGVILKLTGSLELNPSSSLETKYFSIDTHTVYPPSLELRWDDSVYNTGSSTHTTITNNNIVILSNNNLESLKADSKYRINLTVRDRYPTRIFTTSSLYASQWKYLPVQSYWSIVDIRTNEKVIDFDSNYTKISANSEGNYLTIYTKGLQPERYYKLIVKTIVGSTQEDLIIDNNIFIKVER